MTLSTYPSTLRSTSQNLGLTASTVSLLIYDADFERFVVLDRATALDGLTKVSFPAET